MLYLAKIELTVDHADNPAEYSHLGDFLFVTECDSAVEASKRLHALVRKHADLPVFGDPGDSDPAGEVDRLVPKGATAHVGQCVALSSLPDEGTLLFYCIVEEFEGRDMRCENSVPLEFHGAEQVELANIVRAVRDSEGELSELTTTPILDRSLAKQSHK